MHGYLCLIFFECVAIQHVVCIYFTRCYNDNEYCLWTDDAVLKSWSDAKSYCQSNNSTLLTVTNDDTQAALMDFRTYVNASSSSTSSILTTSVWIDVSTADANSFHWINEPTGQPGVDNQAGDSSFVARRFGAIFYTTGSQRITYYAQEFNSLSFYICQFTGVDCSDGLTRNSICYRKYNSESVTWFTASNKCLSMNGSLATFSDLTDQNAPKNDKNLTQWLNSTVDTTYWIGLLRRWFVTHGPDGTEVDVQYTNWPYAPGQPDGNRKCVLVEARTTTWLTMSCTDPVQERLVCQAELTSVRQSTPLPPTTKLATTGATTWIPSTHVPSLIGGDDIVGTAPSQMSRATAQHSIQSATVTQCHDCNTTSLAVGLAVGLGLPLAISLIINIMVLTRRRKLEKVACQSQKNSAIPKTNLTEVIDPSINDSQQYATLGSAPSGSNPVYTQLQAQQNGVSRLEYEMVG